MIHLPMVEEKDTNLRQLLRNFTTAIGTETLTHRFDQLEVQAVLEEFLYWKKMEDTAIGPDMKKKALYFQKCYEEIQPIWS